MGHTVASQRIVAETVLNELKEFGRSLRQEEKEAFNRLMARAVKHLGNISFACSYNTWALILFSMMLEQEKER